MNASFLAISDDCLQIQTHPIKLGLNFAFGGILSFLFIALPVYLYVLILILSPPYTRLNEQNEVVNVSFIEFISTIPIPGLLITLFFLFVFGGMLFLLSLNFARVTRNALISRVSPIIFNRQQQLVLSVFDGKKASVHWADIRHKKFMKTNLGPALIPMQRRIVEIEGLGMIEGDEQTWSYINSFMENGPDNLKVPVFFSDSWEHQSKYSRSFKDAVHHHWFWPIIRNPALPIVISYLFWPFKVLLFIPFLMTEWIWRRMAIKGYRKSKIFPTQRLLDCGCAGEKITGKMATSVYRDLIDKDGINYLEVKRRLKEKNLGA